MKVAARGRARITSLRGVTSSFAFMSLNAKLPSRCDNLEEKVD